MFNIKKSDKVLKTILDGTKTKEDTYTITHDEADALVDEVVTNEYKEWFKGFAVGVSAACLGMVIASLIRD